jgi:histidinol phosphatase-like enzyme
MNKPTKDDIDWRIDYLKNEIDCFDEIVNDPQTDEEGKEAFKEIIGYLEVWTKELNEQMNKL